MHIFETLVMSKGWSMLSHELDNYNWSQITGLYLQFRALILTSKVKTN